jgi:hypothetical protein
LRIQKHLPVFKSAIRILIVAGLLYRAGCRIVVEDIEIKTRGHERGATNHFRSNPNFPTEQGINEYTMLNRIRLGDDVRANCGRCKEERLHQVVALHSDGRIERVTCNYCQSTHRYRDPQAAATVKARRTTGARATEAKTRAVSNQPARPYSPREVYAVGDNISHTKFGEGSVVEARQGKIDVRFGREMRTLLHAG